MRMRRKLTQVTSGAPWFWYRRGVLGRVIAVMLVASSVAGASPESGAEPVVLIANDATFASALDDALVPAGLDVVAVGMIAAPSSAELPSRSRELADARQATATVWLLPTPGGATLVAYDRHVDRLLVRELPYRSPLSATQSAEAARMVRTMLRALRVNDGEPTSTDVVPGAPAGPPPPLLAASIGAGAWFAAPGDDSALAASLAIAWRPHGLGVAVTGVVAPAATVMTPSFAGRVRDVVVAAEARQALSIAPDVWLTPAAGLAVHAVQLDGSFDGSVSGGDLTSRRYDPAIRLGILGSYALPRGVDVGVSVSADCLLRRQRYEAGTEQILVVPRIQIVTGVMVGIRL
jgi:hypothetical protein